MGYGIVETTNYLLFTNPVSQGVFTGLSEVARGLVSLNVKEKKDDKLINSTSITQQGITPKNSSGKVSASTKVVNSVKFPLHDLAGCNLLFIRIAGVSGASAVAINAYYTHYHKSHPLKDPELKQIFEKTSKFHFVHSLALVAVPLVRRPWLVS